jgi:excisionase family DNA binding protein
VKQGRSAPKQAAEIMGPTEAQVRGLIRAGRIAYVMVGTRRMIPAQQLKISSCKNTVLPAPSDGRYVCPDRQSATLFRAGAQTTEGEMNADGNVTGRFSCRQRTQVDKIQLVYIGVQVFG